MPFKGTFFLVVGPSGVGKDTLLDGARAALGGLAFYRFCRRYVTRGAGAGGEDHLAVSEAEFAALRDGGGLLYHWQAHGLNYGLPADIRDDLARGVHVVVNASRRELAGLVRLWDRTVVISVEASPEIVAARLAARGREGADEIRARIARQAPVPALPCPVISLRNETTPAAGIAAMVQAIIGSAAQHLQARRATLSTAAGALCILSARHPMAESLRAAASRIELVAASGATMVADLAYDVAGGDGLEDCCRLDPRLMDRLGLAEGEVVGLRPAPSPGSREVLRRKVRGEELGPEDMERVVEDMVRGRYTQGELAAFLVSAARQLSTDEVIALARARAARTEILRWAAPVVVDKHSMGGIPGNRITPIIIPIVTAAGLTMPKTSSRAITSASGTADAMEVLARVDLSADDLRRVVAETGGCIAWNGRLTQSPVDDVMNAINRPLGLRSARLDVSSILSKKRAAGSTHVLIDMPVGPEAKTRTLEEARALETLFVTVAEALGMQARVMLTDGTGPVGRGIGPVLEMRDALAVLAGDPAAPADLREKALHYAATILDWAAPDPGRSGRSRAEALLASGAAARQFERIVEAQGRRLPVPVLAPLSREIAAPASMTLAGFGVRAVSAIGRAAGAPQVPGAGVDLLCAPGTRVTAGMALLRIHAATSFALEAAAAEAMRALAAGTLAREATAAATQDHEILPG